ncbi:winged helix-turn-helix transcriptional regulator [Streptococcus sp. HF-1907]|uniref:MarR family winged helix-turn-helix transcriptional regulator n=1 Tax=Streptococcus sp. HF-1907 TaxID=2785793 RepID=UPI00189CA267|nr:MarR family winged helix-turn-helix transcriptional regulator [Streptococcus sp. HF-1907]MBF7094386.1 winged helix-turn-helix transcriptional regulator [Streptococcus sp. HF-1907]
MTDSYGRLLKQASNQMGRRFDYFAKKNNLTGTQMSVIDFLSRQEKEDYFQRDIEREFNIQRSTTTVLLQRMETKGLISRTVSKKDARQKSVILTDKAKSLAQISQDYLEKENEDLHRRFSVDELNTFKAILDYYIYKEDED